MRTYLRAICVAAVALGAGQAAAQGNWSGFYGGFMAGPNDFTFDWDEGSTPSLGSFNGSISGPSLGGFAGYNWQNGTWVYGVEVEAEGFDANANFAGVPGPGLVNASIDWAAGIRGRVGQDTGNALPYAFLGASWAHLDTNAIGFSMQDAVHTGVSLGIGVDVMIAPRVFGRAEVVHTIYGEKHYEYCLPGSCPADISFDRTAVRLGVGMRF